MPLDRRQEAPERGPDGMLALACDDNASAQRGWRPNASDAVLLRPDRACSELFAVDRLPGEAIESPPITLDLSSVMSTGRVSVSRLTNAPPPQVELTLLVRLVRVSTTTRPRMAVSGAARRGEMWSWNQLPTSSVMASRSADSS